MYCPTCMKYNKNEKAVRCGYCNEPMNLQNAPFQLPVGTILAGRYYVGKVLGQGGFGITYVGCDLKLNMKVAIKEYYPQGVVGRISTFNLGLTVNTEVQKTVFVAQKDRFMKEARILAEFSSDIHVVRVSDIFEENNTAYIVMEYVEGITLESYCRQQGRMAFNDIWKMISPLVETLARIHDKGLIHRDISPANIMLNNSVGVKLIDFGAARDFSTSDEKSLSVVLKPGYAPPEQYSSRGQGPWTDVYALCATIYRVITGVVPESAFDRIGNDELKYPSDLGVPIKAEQEAVLMCGLAIKKDDRLQSMKELNQAIVLANKSFVTERIRKYHRGNLSMQSENEYSNKSNTQSLSSVNQATNKKQTAQKQTDIKLENLKENHYKKENPSENKSETSRREEKRRENYIQENNEKKNEKKNNAVVGILIGVAAIGVVVFFVLFTVIIPSSRYKKAVSLMENKDYEEAINAFEKLNGYKDANEKIDECRDVLNDIEYNKALSLMEDKKYNDAISIFSSLDGYKQSKEKVQECEKVIQSAKQSLSFVKTIETIHVGQELYFGNYEQADSSYKDEKRIKWIVLKIENGKVLLISKYALDCKPYHNQDENVTWEDCSLREWLNKDFIDEAFTWEQQNIILTTEVTADANSQFDSNSGKSVSDKIFLLSTDEAEQLFSSAQERKCSPTSYAMKQGAFVGNNGSGWWFLRTPGNSNNRVSYVNTGGTVDYKGSRVVSGDACVRPAMWIDLT